MSDKSLREIWSKVSSELLDCAEKCRDHGGGNVVLTPSMADDLAIGIDTLAKAWDELVVINHRHIRELSSLKSPGWRLYKALMLMAVGWLIGHYG